MTRHARKKGISHVELSRMDIMIEGTLLGHSLSSIAREHGWSLNGTYELTRTEEFRSMLAERRKERRERHEQQLEALVAAAIAAQTEILEDRAHVDRAKVADAVLKRAGFDQPTKVEVSNPYASMSAEELAAKHEAEARRLRGE